MRSIHHFLKKKSKPRDCARPSRWQLWFPQSPVPCAKIFDCFCLVLKLHPDLSGHKVMKHNIFNCFGLAPQRNPSLVSTARHSQPDLCTSLHWSSAGPLSPLLCSFCHFGGDLLSSCRKVFFFWGHLH